MPDLPLAQQTAELAAVDLDFIAIEQGHLSLRGLSDVGHEHLADTSGTSFAKVAHQHCPDQPRRAAPPPAAPRAPPTPLDRTGSPRSGWSRPQLSRVD